MKILGIDPGIHGGLSIVEITDGAAPVLVECVDIPVIGSGAKERVDVIALRNWLTTHKPQHAYIERRFIQRWPCASTTTGPPLKASSAGRSAITRSQTATSRIA
jgi:Holliday junction resolvasome RuvABC endonuclease subunit